MGIYAKQFCNLKRCLSTLKLTANAKQRLAQLSQQYPDEIVQMKVDFGGCHGLQYSFQLIPLDKAPTKE